MGTNNTKIMTLEEATVRADRTLLTNPSDGCTFAPELGISHWCKRHDMWRRFKIVPRDTADEYLRDGIKSEGGWYVIVAYIYYFGVRIGVWFNLYN